MKTLTALVVVCTSAAFLTFALPQRAIEQSGASDASGSGDASTQPCCQAKEPASGKPEADDEACCSTEKTTGGDCSNCAKKPTTTSNITTESDSAQCGGMCEDKCESSCVSNTATAFASKAHVQKSGDCPEQDCKGNCAQCVTANSESQQEITARKCELCTAETCKQECSSCAAATSKPASADGESKAPHAGMGRGHSGDSQHAKDHQDFFFLIEHRDAIRRTVRNLPNGFESLTESDDPEIAQMIQVHVAAMYDRVENGSPIRMRDPIFRAIFSNADQIEMKVESTDHGVRVTETSSDAYVVKVLQEHAKVVSLWMKNGYAELPKNHPAPKR